MAKQKGIIKLKGRMGDLTFYKTKDGYAAREMGGIDKHRIANDPAFQRTRENGEEFGRAGKAGKLLRTALRPLLVKASDSRMVSRLTQRMMKIIQTDMVSNRGKRNITDGEIALLRGFEFNNRGKLSNTLYAPYSVSINREDGELVVQIDPFVPLNMLSAPSGTTHFKIFSAGVEIDFRNENFAVTHSESSIISWDTTLTTALIQTNVVTPESLKSLVVVVGLEFYQEINGEMYPLKNGAFNSLSIVDANGLD